MYILRSTLWLSARLDQLRVAWRVWADAWAVDFNALCKTHGFLPGAGLQQRTLFDDVVRPMTQETGPTAYFVVDALRFEMGVELFRELEGTAATTVLLKARLCELPSVTEVGMNVLAPVAHNGRLQPKLDDTPKVLGFQAGEFRVTGPETRKRAMHDRVGGATCPWLTLAEVQSRDSASLKLTVARASLVVVHSQEIDNAGEKGVGPTVFDTVMRQLRAAWRLLRDAGVRRFVFTSDHGFLLLDDSAQVAQPHGRKTDPKRRHVFSSVAADHAGEVRVALADLGYDGVSGHVMFPETTAPFDRGNRSMSFVHGGNSLQERVIPVLTVVHRAAAGGTTLQYGVTAKQLEDVAGMFCVEVKVAVEAQHALDFGSPKELDLALRAVEADDVQVELCQARGKARIAGGAVRASVGERFELFFRLTGPDSTRVRLELHHPGAVADVTPCVLPDRFSVMGTRPPTKQPPPLETPSGEAKLETPAPILTPPKDVLGAGWLDDFEGGVRQVFEHLAAHGTVTEPEAASMLGGPRQFRRFARDFDDYAKKAPFVVRIAEVAGVKRYVREGNG
ncbi:MAG: BREX-6 system phosphatase PglZ [Myxococcales bacterium]|nr:BREX-6 system phosphatase PglZ [Myxococcales bacterium]